MTLYHNPNSIYPINPELFEETVAQSFFDADEKNIVTIMPEVFPYSNLTKNAVLKK